MYVSPYLIAESPIPKTLSTHKNSILRIISPLQFCHNLFSPEVLKFQSLGYDITKAGLGKYWALSRIERLRVSCIIDAIIAAVYGLNYLDLKHMLRDCAFDNRLLNSPPEGVVSPKGFWRVDKEDQPELRQTVLTLVAYCDLDVAIKNSGGDVFRGISSFLESQNGRGWQIPDSVRLTDYDLDFCSSANDHQPVAGLLGPNFLEWQLEQTVDESWSECKLHARNILGEESYQKLIRSPSFNGQEVSEARSDSGQGGKSVQSQLF